MPHSAATLPGRSTRPRAVEPSSTPPRPACLLSPRQRETLTLVARGATDKQIGRLLHISAITVNHHLARARDRLGATHTAHAVAVAIRLHIIEIEEL